MGTQQQLTTQQAELLILIKEIADFDKEQPGNIPPGGIGEIIVGNSIMTFEELEDARNILEYYGYLRNGFELTVDGKQYIELFREFLQEKMEKLEELEKLWELEEPKKQEEPDKVNEILEKLEKLEGSSIVHNSFSLIKIDKIEVNINKPDISGEVSGLVKRVQAGIRGIKEIKERIWK